MKMNHHDKERSAARLGRFVPLAGVVSVVLTIAGYFAIGPFPDSDSPISKLTSFYSTHHERVAAGGILLAWSTILFAVFGVAVWARIHRSGLHPSVAGAALVGTAVATAGGLFDGSVYSILGDIGHQQTTSPAALQAWHIMGSEGQFVGSGGAVVLLLAVASAGILGRAFPRWLAWPALPLGILQLVPGIGFFASLVFLLWTAVASIVMVRESSGEAPAPARIGSTLPA
jgi:hypothetical protein